MIDFRCSKCDKLMAKVGENSQVEIKCPWCNNMNRTNIITKESHDMTIKDRWEKLKNADYPPSGMIIPLGQRITAEPIDATQKKCHEQGGLSKTI